MHEIYCSDEPQVVPHQVPLVDQDPPGDITPTPLGLSSHRLDQPSLGDRVNIDYTLDKGSNDIPVSGEHSKLFLIQSMIYIFLSNI